MINKERIVQKFMEYVQISSPSTKEKEFAEFIKEELESIGLDVSMDRSGEKFGSNSGNIIARLAGDRRTQPILFSCHLDTVSPGEGIQPIIKGDAIYSRGDTILGADDKAGIAAVIEALRVIKENHIPHGPIEVVFSVCEEKGLLGAKHLDYNSLQSKRAFVLDSGGSPGEIITQGPAQDSFHVKILGKAAHAGVSPEEGISAIHVAAHAIAGMKLLRIDEETTANIGVIHGGEATNIVAPEVVLEGEARSLDEDKLDEQSGHMVEVFERTAQKFGAQIEIKREREYNAFRVDEEDEIVHLVKKACKNIGIEAYTSKTGGGSDTNVFNANGIKAVNLATGERKPHTLEEYLIIDDLVKTAKMVMEIIKEG